MLGSQGGAPGAAAAPAQGSHSRPSYGTQTRPLAEPQSQSLGGLASASADGWGGGRTCAALGTWGHLERKENQHRGVRAHFAARLRQGWAPKPPPAPALRAARAASRPGRPTWPSHPVPWALASLLTQPHPEAPLGRPTGGPVCRERPGPGCSGRTARPSLVLALAMAFRGFLRWRSGSGTWPLAEPLGLDLLPRGDAGTAGWWVWWGRRVPGAWSALAQHSPLLTCGGCRSGSWAPAGGRVASRAFRSRTTSMQPAVSIWNSCETHVAHA